MSVVFFEGFNHDNGDAIRLDPTYWSSPDMASISFNSGRTHNGVYIANSVYADGITANKKLNLSNFNSPLSSTNAFGVGFWNNAATIKPECRLISFSNTNVEVLGVNVITTTYSSSNDSIGLQIIQNGVSKGIYDFKAVVGYNYSVVPFWGPQLLNSEVYLEFYIDPKNTNSLRIRVNGLDMVNQSGSTNTNINSFSNIDNITLYGTHNSWRSESRVYDDFYLSNGNSIEETLLGKEVRIYRLNPESNSSTMEWTSNRGWGPGQDLGTNDGDNSFYFTETNNKTALFNMNNLPVSTGSVGGIKILNSARKVAANVTFSNVYSPADGQSISDIGSVYSVNSNSYAYFNSFILKNPATNNDWTINDINNLQLGMKKLS